MQDHTRALSACISNPPRDWRRPRGRPRQTWLRTIEKDLQEQNLGLWTAWFYAQDRVRWRKVVEAAIRFSRGTRHDDDQMMMMNITTRSVAVARKADRTAYNVRYIAAEPEPNRRKCRVWNSHSHVTTLPVARRGNFDASFFRCVLWLNDTSYSKSA